MRSPKGAMSQTAKQIRITTAGKAKDSARIRGTVLSAFVSFFVLFIEKLRLCVLTEK